MSSSHATTAPVPSTPSSFLSDGHSLKSWLLTLDHKRIGILYLLGVSFFFLLGGLFAMLVRLELLTPAGDLMLPDTYNRVFTGHGVMMVFFFSTRRFLADSAISCTRS